MKNPKTAVVNSNIREVASNQCFGIQAKNRPLGLVNMKTIVIVIVSILGMSYTFPQSGSNNLPAVFKNNLVSLSIPLNTDTLLMYTDTGGKNFLYRSGIQKLDTRRSKVNLWEKSNIENLLIERNIPIPYLKEIYFINDKSSIYDGMLGREWFADKIWEFDYENKTLKNLEFPVKQTENSGQIVKLHFKSDASGNHSYHLPRIQIIVKSDTLSMLFDSGAQAFLSVEAQQELKKNELVATSFISASIFEKWRKIYPEWPIIKGGDLSFGEKADIIIVPEIQIGERTLGPVEFVSRADSNFEVMSSFFMDEEIEGALGGNALFRLRKFVVDYRNEELRIEN